jgi:hypothetical protein
MDALMPTRFGGAAANDNLVTKQADKAMTVAAASEPRKGGIS